MARNIFNSVPLKKIKRNSFDLSFTNDYTADFGFLYPVICQDAYAGEIYRISLESFIRSMPLRAPAFTECNQSYHLFFVPYRLIYEDWSKFIVRGDDAVTNYDKPYFYYESFYGDQFYQFYQSGSLMDYLNFPTANSSGEMAEWNAIFQSHLDSGDDGPRNKIDMLPFNAYNLIFNEYYRDENLQPEVFIWFLSGYDNNMAEFHEYLQQLIEDGFDPTFAFPWILRRRAWRKDYFTSALPFTQKGPEISLMGVVNPASGDETVQVNFGLSNWQIGDPSTWFLNLANTSQPIAELLATPATGAPVDPSADFSQHTHSVSSNSREAVAYIRLPEMQSTLMTISDLRVGLALQQWFELDARVGSSRYFEYLLGHFGVRDRDSRLQRPEYIGGFTHAIQISEVEQTSATNETSPQGNLAGRGLGYAVNKPLTYRVPEPGFIMCLSSMRPRAYYYQGMPRKYQTWDSFDYYDPLFDHIGEQAIKRSELIFNPANVPLSDDDLDFGYTPYYSHRRAHLNEVHGGFRSDLKYWISPREVLDFSKLDYKFIEVDGYEQGLYDMFSFVGDSDNVSPHFNVHLNVHMKLISPMSKYAVPGL